MMYTRHNNKSQKISKNLSLVWWRFIKLFTYHYLIDLWCLLLCIILLPDPSLTNSIHAQCWPTHVLLLPDHDGWGNWHCLCSKIQSVSNSHTVCNLLKIDNHTLSANSLLMIFGIGNVIIAYVEQSNSVWAHLERSHVIYPRTFVMFSDDVTTLLMPCTEVTNKG